VATTIATYPVESLIAAGILGYDLTEEEIGKIEALEAKKKEDAEKVDEQTQQGNMTLPTDEENQIADELRAWRTFTEKPHKREFETKHIPSALALRINAGLRQAKTQDDIIKVFDMAAGELPVIMLAKAINAMDK
jgi:hypothetical protein